MFLFEIQQLLVGKPLAEMVFAAKRHVIFCSGGFKCTKG